MKNRHKIASIDQSGSLGVRPQRCGRERNLGLCILHFSKFVTRESTHLITLSRTFAIARRLDRALAHDALDAWSHASVQPFAHVTDSRDG